MKEKWASMNHNNDSDRDKTFESESESESSVEDVTTPTVKEKRGKSPTENIKNGPSGLKKNHEHPIDASSVTNPQTNDGIVSSIGANNFTRPWARSIPKE